TTGRSTTHDEGRIWRIKCPLSISTRKFQDERGHTSSGIQRAYPVAQIKRSKSTADRCLAVAEHVPSKANPRLDEVVVVVANGAVRCQLPARKAIRRTLVQTDLGQDNAIARRTAPEGSIVSDGIEVAVMIVSREGIAQK